MSQHPPAFKPVHRLVLCGLILASVVLVVVVAGAMARRSADHWLDAGVLCILCACLAGIARPMRHRLMRESGRLAAQSRELSKLSMIATLTSNAAVMTDLGGRIEWVNAGFERITGYSLAETRGRTPGSILQCEKTDPRVIADLSVAIRERRSIRREILNRSKDGRLYWLDLDIHPMFDEAGQAIGFVAIQADITDAKLFTAAIEEKNANLEMMSRLANVGMWTLDIGRDALVWSDQVRVIHEVGAGYRPDFAEALAFYPTDVQARMSQTIANALETRQAWDFETPFVTAKGNHRWVRSVGAPIVEGDRLTKFIGAFQDVTETVCARQDIALANQRLELATDSAHIGLWDWNVAEDSFWTSARWWAYLGFSTSQPLVGDDIADQVIHPDDIDGVRANREIFLRDRLKQLVNEFRHRDGRGEWRWILSTGQVTRWGADGTVTRVSGVYIDIHERKIATEKIAYAARHDGLTGLANRAELKRRIDESVAGHQADGMQFSVLMMDLDLFKGINDMFGHATGDAVLKAVAGRIQSVVRNGDLVARLGGDEFAILFQASDRHREMSNTIAGRLLEAICTPYETEGRKLTIGVSIGIAIAPDHGTDAETLLHAADSALYKVKAEGRSGVCFFDTQLEAEALERRELETDLRESLVRDAFELDYQRIVALEDTRILGAETRLLWRHPVRGLIGPDIVMPIAEKSGLIIPIGEWIIRQACKDAAAWPDEAFVAVDISATQLGGSDLVGVVTQALLASRLPPRRLQLEIAETAFLNSDDALLSGLQRLHELGVRLVLDDFGTGHASLGHLCKLPFATIKVHASLVRDLGRNPQATAIVCAVTNLAQSLAMDATAAGVETEMQARLAAAAGCSLAQGPFFAEPAPQRKCRVGHAGPFCAQANWT